MKEVTLGIDVGGTYTKFGFITHEGEAIYDSSVKTTGHHDIAAFQKSLADEIKKAFDELDGDYKLVGVGIGAPNGNYYNGTIEYAPNLDWKDVVPFVDMFKNHFDLPMALTNDANAAAIGEMIFGEAKNLKNFVVITLGTGLGSGLVVNGDVVYDYGDDVANVGDDNGENIDSNQDNDGDEDDDDFGDDNDDYHDSDDDEDDGVVDDIDNDGDGDTTSSHCCGWR